MSISVSEQETTISFSRDEKKVSVWSNDSTMITKLDKMCEASPDNYQVKKVGRSADGALLDKEYVIADKGLISFRSGKRKQELTEEQRAARAERLKVGRENKGKSSQN